MIFLVALITLLLDQWFKILVERSFDLGQSLPVIDDVFHLTYVRNQGAAFGLFSDYTVILIVISLVILAGVFYLLFSLKLESTIIRLAFGLVIGGAIGNLVDRIRLGYVIDYLDFRIWPVFNLADVALVIGCGLIIVLLWKSRNVIQ